ncbi:antibiotic biosynthesis monooxygenase family protein [Terricaulis sp.]|uniref:antibiotic biosynthesis monooxygenase family protein n=1 Tax=Terricaulis sp. TaxID=2768686 RepID=UPI0037841428
MFAVVYRWRVIAGLEAEFEAGWRAGTERIAAEFGGWGSRLHKGDGDVYVAYAQWPDEATWRKAMETRMHHSDDAAREKYRRAIVPGSFETLFSGEVVADLLQPRPA